MYIIFNETSASAVQCSENDAAIKALASNIQGLFQNRPMPTSEAELSDSDQEYLSVLSKKYDVDIISYGGPDNLYIYFKNGCKLHIRPNNYAVYKQ